jgi:hypothetical protein
MCLKIIQKTNLTKKQQSGRGWKVFRKEEGFYVGPYFHYRVALKPGVWAKSDKPTSLPTKIPSDTVTIIRDANGEASYQWVCYDSGFHLFFVKRAAMAYKDHLAALGKIGLVVKRVSYRGAHTIGIQGDERVIVAKEVMIER